MHDDQDDPGAVSNYPLQWPLGWPRKRFRASSNFSMSREDRTPKGEVYKRITSINMATATDRLEKQLDALGAKNPVLSTNVSLSMRGTPRGDERPSDPGAAVYFSFKGRATVLACDSFVTVAENIAALAAHIDALRRIDRYGVGSLEQALAGYKALPADSAADWRVALFGANVPSPVTRAAVDSAYKHQAREKHPDLGGSDDAMAWLNRARDYALQELGE